MSIDWNWGIFLQQAPFGNTTYLGWIWSGFQVTIALSICAWIIAFLVGSFFGILRTVPNRFLSGLGTLYVELFRNVPLVDCAILYLVSGDPGAVAGENRHVV
ncbi:glutamate/aspartate ABC transporter permease GltJ [Shigella sonnei]|nr:glutamate/aspartate ABC transporter permease GltJ [Shigella sonnei]